MKKIFILGASSLQIPAIKKAKEKGLYVYALDYNPEAEGISLADEFLCISTIDKEAVLEAAVKYKPDYIITSTSDMPVRTVAWVNEKLGRPVDITYQNAICATDKGAMRDRLKENNVPIPQFYIVNDYETFSDVLNKFKDVFIIKPADNAASRGVMLIDKKQSNDYKKIFEFTQGYSRSGRVLLEEYMDGPEVSVETYTENGKSNIITITDKITTKLPYFVELGHTEPSRHPDKIQQEIKKVALQAIKAIGINNGPSHTELKLTQSGVKVVEIAARLGGDFITSRLVPLSTGVDMVDCSLSHVVGEYVDCDIKLKRGAAIRFISANEGVIRDIKGIDIAKGMPGVQEVCIMRKVGDKISGLKNSSDRIGYVISIGDNADEAEKNCMNAIEQIKITVQSC